MDFGAFVNFLGSRDGLVHISELAPQRVKQTSDVVAVGDAVKVKVLGVDDRGKVKLSMKAVDRPCAMTIARTGPYRFASGVLPIAAIPIVTFARARRGPLHVSGTANLSSIQVATSGMKNPAPRPMSPLMPENFKRGRQSIDFGRASRGRTDSR